MKAAAENAVAAPSVEHGSPLATSPSRRRFPRLVLGMGSLLLVGLLVGWWLRSGRRDVGGPSSQAAVFPTPASPPEAFQVALAAPIAEADARSQPSVEQALSRVTEVVSRRQSAIKETPLAATAPASFIVVGGGRPSSDQRSAVPRHERWEIQFPPGNADTYARVLDYFKIELAVVGGPEQIVYLSKLAEAKPIVRTGSTEGDSRLYLVWNYGSMREAGEQLAARAKVQVQGKVFAHFCSPQLEQELASLEASHARQQGEGEIRKTVFGIQSNGFGGYRFTVLEQKLDKS